jgi:energy-coupling factor transport system ATP-binding protein
MAGLSRTVGSDGEAPEWQVDEDMRAAGLISTEPDLVIENLTVSYGDTLADDDVTVTFPAGRVTVLMGRNGSGKSSLLWALSGAGPHDSGHWQVGAVALEGFGVEKARDYVRLVPQQASDLLFHQSVAAECQASDEAAGMVVTQALLDRLAPGIDPAAHPRDLSQGQQLALALAIQLAGVQTAPEGDGLSEGQASAGSPQSAGDRPSVLLLDEPTRGLDYAAKRVLADNVQSLAATSGMVVVVATHDVEFAAHIADRVVVMAEGQIIADGYPIDVLESTTALAPQIAKIMAPETWLTVEQLTSAARQVREP